MYLLSSWYKTMFVKHKCNSKDGQGHKDKYLDTSKNILSQEMLMCNLKTTLISIIKKLWKCPFFNKVDIKQNNISTVILFIKFLVYQWDPRHLQGSRVVYIYVYIMKFVSYLISNHIFVCINHKDTF